MSGVTLKDRRRTKDLRKGLVIESVDRVVSRGRLRWFGHVERKGADDWVSECRRGGWWVVWGRGGIGIHG